MAGRIPDHFIDELLERTDIVSLIESHIPLKKAGKDFQANCPFHSEKSPSFTVSREKQFYHCFGCGAHGTAISFLMNYQNFEFREAVSELALSAGMEVPTGSNLAPSNSRQSIFPILEKACVLYERSLRNFEGQAEAVNYLKSRGITGLIAKKFRLGFAPKEWRYVLDNMLKDNVTETDLERAGLIVSNDKGNRYDRFRGRIVFPITDHRKRVIGFGGRIIGEGQPKYLNSPETTVFQKRRALYGLEQALANKNLKEVLVVEGYMDVIALNQFGISNVVATLGTSVTTEHIERILNHTSVIRFCFDGDDAGVSAAWKALETSVSKLEGDRELKFRFLPSGHDPDTAVREFGSETFLDKGKTYSFSDYLLLTLAKELDISTDEGRTRLIAKAKPYVTKIPDDGHKNLVIKRLAEETRFDEKVIRRNLQQTYSKKTEPNHDLRRYSSRSLQEQTLALLLQNPQIVGFLDDTICEFLEEHLDGCEALLSVRTKIKGGATTTAALLERYRGDRAESAFKELVSINLGRLAENLETVAKDAVARLVSKAEEERYRKITRIPLSKLSSEQKEILRNYKRSD